jgi:hypothetical protein
MKGFFLFNVFVYRNKHSGKHTHNFDFCLINYSNFYYFYCLCSLAFDNLNFMADFIIARTTLSSKLLSQDKEYFATIFVLEDKVLHN